jgi:hypothetical protein
MYRTLIVIFDALDDILSWARRPFDKKPDDRVRWINLPPSFALNPRFDVASRV